ncbi:MAG: hypothetical protein K6F58_02685 [Bacteroidales bacterium]|nr:hypothetical protein [Bacteroidales bacterium]
MKKNHFLIIATAIITIAIGCKKEVASVIESTNDFSEKEQFAQALSIAVHESEALRAFIKTEALKEFDKDYDVFYPYVRDLEIANGKTFRDYMLDNLSELELARIEQALPLLNISVPDWEWLDAFSINSWDTSDADVVVGFSSSSKSHRVYYKGQAVDELSVGMFPANPTIIVKENERMKVVSPATRSEQALYDFADEAFRPEPVTRRDPPEITYYYPVANPGSNLVDTTEFQQSFPEVVAAWKEYGTDPFGAQRRLVYYGIHSGENEGTLNPHIKENILAIRLIGIGCMDDNDIDSRLRDHTFYDQGIPASDMEALINAVWNSGQLEIMLYATTVDSSGNKVVINEKVIPVHAKKLFDISKIERRYWHKTWFTRKEYLYIGRYADLTPKWYYLEYPVRFEHWEPTSESSYITVHAYEKDGSSTTTVTETVKDNDGITLSYTGGQYTFTFNSPNTYTERTVNYTITQGSDDLYWTNMNFNDYIITGEQDGKYSLKVYSTGYLEFILVPEDC